MSALSSEQAIGIDVSRDWLDIHCLPDATRLRLPNTSEGHARVASLALRRGALVCFEATSGQKWRLRASLDALRIVARQLPPAVVPGPRRIDAELIACVMVCASRREVAIRPESCAGSEL
ncbi:hypothetical protein KO516_17600 [Citreicella sp. C3M06]|uniref:hypothetical protein n=1 Tax=Citreicella sp. C3M06 TaxID=2841564 RepID=UPI001C0A432A|nr:hypothetical protein [Citreicella sp. C3M06]MBU2962607.1 hypothetical protein [Citreicella sp. C3M06]